MGFARQWLQTQGVAADLVILTEGPSSKRPDTNHRFVIIDLSAGTGKS
jgi:pyruvate kinase